MKYVLMMSLLVLAFASFTEEDNLLVLNRRNFEKAIN